MRFLEVLVVLTGTAAVYAAIGEIRNLVAEDPFVFLRIFTVAREPLPSFITFLAFLIPIVAITLAFDSVNGEFNRRTISRILAQPIYRDALLMGKFLGGLLVLAICLVTLWLLMTGFGILLLGLPPGGEEILRGLAYLFCSLAYAGVWLAVALLFSTVFRSPATSALAALTLWLLFSIFWSMIAPLIANAFAPVNLLDQASQIANMTLDNNVSRISPNTLYGEMTLGLLSPNTRSFGVIFLSQLKGAVLGNPLPFSQSALLIWPQLAGLAATMLLVFTIAYVTFQRQEIRA
jgi:ABC-2 type transport system permease protein